MLFTKKTPQEKRKVFREKLKSNELLQLPGAFAPIAAMMIEKEGFDGVYISGAVLSNDLGYPDIGFTTLTEVSQRARAIARATDLASIVDIDTGFGESMNVARTIREIEDMGLSGCHIEDQVNPKRCGHLDNKQVIEKESMIQKIKAAVEAKTDANFLIMARTDSRGVEGLEKSLDRIKAYVDSGAEAIFPEAMKDEKEFEAIRKAVDVPLLANMTEFGKSKLLTEDQLKSLGYNLVIYPVSTLRMAMKATENFLKEVKSKGTQEGILDQMQTRQELYDLLRYEDYNEFDSSIYNFKI